jgi:DNA mismatch endonuclease (patch repair protein)
MSDIFTRNKRSDIMSKVSGKETRPEVFLRKYLFAQGFRYRKNVKDLPGKPDIVLSKYKTIIFVNGCFWHGHTNCKKAALPTSNTQFWKEKISGNIIRDAENIRKLQELGYKVLTVWQCELTQKVREQTLNTLIEQITL